MLTPFVSIYHFLWALFSALFFGFPSRKIKVIGITGTSGKSTIVDLTINILEKAGYKVAALSSIKIKIADDEKENLFKMTMPGRGYLQRFLKKAKDKGCQYAIIEVTSEGILQHRHRFINFTTAVFTNLYPEHIERHGGFKNYRATKGKFFQTTKGIHILNLDDKNTNYFLQFPAERKIGFITCNKGSLEMDRGKLRIVEANNCKEGREGITFKVANIDFRLRLLGRFNIQNALAAICIGIAQDISLEICKRALEKFPGVPGRMEIVIEKPFRVVVDYAHTAEALEKIYKTVSLPSFKPKDQKLICVLGSCGGGRDKWKRPKLGEIASEFCDRILITNEDPYDEPPIEIIEQIFKGIKNNKKRVAKKILDRREAIKEALRLAKPGDIVTITGKGCEPWMCIERGKKIPWDDREIAKEEL